MGCLWTACGLIVGWRGAVSGLFIGCLLAGDGLPSPAIRLLVPPWFNISYTLQSIDYVDIRETDLSEPNLSLY